MKALLVLSALVLSNAASAAQPVVKLAVTQRIAGPDGGWDIATIDAEHHRLLVGRPTGVMAVDVATGTVTAVFVPGAGVHEALVAPGTGVGVSTNGKTNRATVFDAATGAVRAEVPTGAKPDAEVWDPASRTMWVMNAGYGSATIVDPVAGKAVGSVAIGGSLEYAVVDGAGHLFVNVEDKNEIVMVDIARRAVVRHTALPGCDGPTGLAITGHGVLIAACANGVAKSVVAATGKLLPDIAIGPRPDAAVDDAGRGRTYIPSGGDGTLTVIDTSGAVPVRLAQVATERGARTGAVDTASGKVYLPAARYAPAVGTARPAMVPGSFEVLVVGDAS